MGDIRPNRELRYSYIMRHCVGKPKLFLLQPKNILLFNSVDMGSTWFLFGCVIAQEHTQFTNRISGDTICSYDAVAAVTIPYIVAGSRGVVVIATTTSAPHTIDRFDQCSDSL